jgi:hypothetical protein
MCEEMLMMKKPKSDPSWSTVEKEGHLTMKVLMGYVMDNQ